MTALEGDVAAEATGVVRSPALAWWGAPGRWGAYKSCPRSQRASLEVRGRDGGLAGVVFKCLKDLELALCCSSWAKLGAVGESYRDADFCLKAQHQELACT